MVTPGGDFIPEYFYIVVERGLPKFIHKYLTTMNLQIDALDFYKIRYHEDLEDQRKVVHAYEEAARAIEEEERIIKELQDLKKFYLDGMMRGGK